MKIIGLTGYSRAGKDTIAAELAGHGWQRVAFADKLKQAAYDANPTILNPDAPAAAATSLQDIVNIIGWDHAKTWPPVRAYLQRHGDATRNQLGGDSWADTLLTEQCDHQDGKYVVTDCRLPDEADQIRARGGHVIRITRPNVTKVNDHISETAMDDYPHILATIPNNQTPTHAADLVRWAVGDQ